jgi:hypothetical protein
MPLVLKSIIQIARFEIFAVVQLRILVFGNVTLCHRVQVSKECVKDPMSMKNTFMDPASLKLRAACSFEALGITYTVMECYVPEDWNCHSYGVPPVL